MAISQYKAMVWNMSTKQPFVYVACLPSTNEIEHEVKLICNIKFLIQKLDHIPSLHQSVSVFTAWTISVSEFLCALIPMLIWQWCPFSVVSTKQAVCPARLSIPQVIDQGG